MECCICKQEIPVEGGSWHLGHNADPVGDGRCCRDCNAKKVIPARLRGLITDDALQAIIELDSTTIRRTQ